MIGGGYYDINRKPISAEQFALLKWDADGRVSDYAVIGRHSFGTGRGEVSTVWLGLDHSFGHGPPVVFETLIFGGDQRLADIEARPHDILAFNHWLIAKYALDHLENLERRHRQEVAKLRAQRGIGAHAAILLHTARRDGRKTIRIDEVLADAERRHKEDLDIARDLVPVGLDEPQ